jgi:neopullulanase
MTRQAPPDWIGDAVLYQIFPDRFARSEHVPKPSGLERWDAPPTRHGYKGGDLLGIVERLDHLADLGVTALYLNPIFASGANHRYHTHDHHRVDPMLGGDAAFRRLRDELHERGMRLILDGVFNHAGRGFLQFHDVLENGTDSPYLDWWHIAGFPLGAYGEGDGSLRYRAWWDLPALPKFNVATPAVREHLWGVATRWLEEGIDGWRLDVPTEIDDRAFWREFRRRCREVRGDAWLVGEIWDDPEGWVGGDPFDGVMHYPLTRAILGLVGRRLDREAAERSGLGAIEPLTATSFAERLRELMDGAPAATREAHMTLLGSHDTARVRTLLGDDPVAVRQAYGLLLALPGAPCLYYGDEIGMAGGHDPANRAAFPWHAPERWDGGLLEDVRARIDARRRTRALRRGRVEILRAEERSLWIGRRDGDERALVVVRLTDGDRAPQDERVTLPPGWRGSWRSLLGGDGFEVEEGGAVRGGAIAGRSCRWFAPA